jgi:hypothetical protein
VSVEDNHMCLLRTTLRGGSGRLNTTIQSDNFVSVLDDLTCLLRTPCVSVKDYPKVSVKNDLMTPFKVTNSVRFMTTLCVGTERPCRSFIKPIYNTV